MRRGSLGGGRSSGRVAPDTGGRHTDVGRKTPMRKRVIGTAPVETEPSEHGWLDLEELAQVEVTSEDAAYPIEAAFAPEEESCWRAPEPGRPSLRLLIAPAHS